MLVLTGTSGNLGSRVLKSLVTHNLIPPSDLAISSSNPSSVPSVASEHSIEVRHGDFTSPSSLSKSFANADAIFLVSFPSPSVERWLHHKAAIDAAITAGVKTVIYSSLMFGGEDGMKSVAGVQQAHIKTVDYLESKRKEVKLQYLVIREGIYAESWWLYCGFQPRTFKKGDTGDIDFVIPNDGPVAWVGWDDLGEGTAKILADYKKYIVDGKGLVNLTGPRATTISQIAKMVEETTGRKVNVKVVGKDEARRYHIEERKSVPKDSSWVVESWSGWHDGIASGETAVIDPLLEKLLGRSPKGIEEMQKELFTPT